MQPSDVRTYLESFTHRDWQESDENDGPVRFAMVGLGWWTSDEAMPAVENSAFCKTTVAVSGSAERAQEVATNHRTIERGITYEEFHEGAATDEYDAVYICTPNARHFEFIESAAEHNKAILCEKPMEATVERAEHIVKACQNMDVTAMIAYRMHTEPAVRRARELVRAGAIGEPVHVHGDMSQSIIEWGPDQWRLDPDLAGYGTSVMDLGIYPLNTTRFILDQDPIAATSMMRADHEYFSEVPDGVASFTVRFKDDVYANCTASQNAQETSHLRIVGTDGEIVIEPAFHMESSLQVTVDTATLDIDTNQVNQMEEEFDYFADCLLTGREPYATPEHGLVDIQALSAIYEAAKTGGTVEL